MTFSFGSRLDVQVLAAGTQEEKHLEALIAQGGKVNTVNAAREEAGLHPITLRNNGQLILEEWIELIKTKNGVVFVALNGFNRTKSDSSVQGSIESCLERFENVHFDRIQGVRNDFFFVYAQEAAIDKKGAKKAKPSTSKTSKNEFKEYFEK